MRLSCSHAHRGRNRPPRNADGVHLHRVRVHRPREPDLQSAVGGRERSRAAPHGQEGPPRHLPQQFSGHKELPEGGGSRRLPPRYEW